MKAKCRDCGAEFAVDDKNKNQRTCQACIEKRAKACAICGKMFNKKGSESYANFEKRMTCSRACAAKYIVKRRKENAEG